MRGVRAENASPRPSERPGEAPKVRVVDAFRPSRWGGGTFTSLSERDYAWYFTGNVAFFMAMQMNLILRGFLAFELTDAASALGVISLTIAMPMLIVAPIGGVVSDWFNKRTLLIVAQAMVGVVNLGMTILIFSGAIEFWHLLVAAVGTGSVVAVVMPARQAVVPQLVPQHKLMNAISLQMGGQNLTRIVGPALGAGLIAPLGVGWAYAITVVLFALAVLSMMPLPSVGMSAREGKAPRRNFREDLTEGFRFVAKRPLFRLLLATALVLPLFAFPVQQVLPVFAADVFEWEDVGLGILAASGGVGGLVGTLIAANLDNVPRKGWVMLFGAGLMASAFIGFALMPLFWVAAVLLALGSIGQMLFMTTNNTVIQAKVPDEYRGRVMSMLMMSFGLMPLGVIPVTVAADVIGVSLAVAISSSLLLVLVMLLVTFASGLRNLQLRAFDRVELSPAQAAQLVADGKITREEADRLTGRAPLTGTAQGG